VEERLYPSVTAARRSDVGSASSRGLKSGLPVLSRDVWLWLRPVSARWLAFHSSSTIPPCLTFPRESTSHSDLGETNPLTRQSPSRHPAHQRSSFRAAPSFLQLCGPVHHSSCRRPTPVTAIPIARPIPSHDHPRQPIPLRWRPAFQDPAPFLHHRRTARCRPPLPPARTIPPDIIVPRAFGVDSARPTFSFRAHVLPRYLPR
jgi:hypothetical protein